MPHQLQAAGGFAILDLEVSGRRPAWQRRVADEVHEIETGNGAVDDHFGAGHYQHTHLRRSGTDDRADQRVVQARISTLGQIENCDIGRHAGLQHASVVEAQHARH